MASVTKLPTNSERGFWIRLAIGLAVLAVGLGSAFVMEHEGHVITGMNNEIVWGTPHVFAGSETDGFFALGYAAAEDRILQMDLLRFQGTGGGSQGEGWAVIAGGNVNTHLPEGINNTAHRPPAKPC